MISDLEIRRQFFHLFGVLSLVLLIYFDIINYQGILSLLIVFIVVGLSIKKIRSPLFHLYFKKLERKKDRKRFPGKGAFFILLGSYFSLLLFEKDIAMASIIILALGDSIAPLVGHYGRMVNPFNRKKFIEGSVIGGIAAMFGAMLFVSAYEAFFASVAAMIVEGIDIKFGIQKLDDNLLMPLAAGAVIWLIRVLL